MGNKNGEGGENDRTGNPGVRRGGHREGGAGKGGWGQGGRRRLGAVLPWSPKQHGRLICIRQFEENRAQREVQYTRRAIERGWWAGSAHLSTELMGTHTVVVC